MNVSKVLSSEQQLQLQFFFHDVELEVASSKRVTPLITADNIQRIELDSMDDYIDDRELTWDESYISKFREAFLMHNLKMLADGRAGSPIKQEILTWMMSDEEHPFAFVTCCRLSGYDPEALRGEVQFTLKRLH